MRFRILSVDHGKYFNPKLRFQVGRRVRRLRNDIPTLGQCEHESRPMGDPQCRPNLDWDLFYHAIIPERRSGSYEKK